MNKKSMGEFIAALRKSKGYTQQDVAERLDVSNKAVSRWERDETAPDISIIPALAELLGVTCDELLRGEKNNGTTEVSERSEAKVDKQIKHLFKRTKSKFKMMSLISMGVAITGFNFMIALELLLRIPIVGVAVMILFEIPAAVVALIAISKAKEAKEDNDLMERLEAKEVEGFNKELDKFGFWSIAIIVMIVSTVIPMVCVRWHFVMIDNLVECSIVVDAILLSAYFFLRDIARKNLTGEVIEKKKRICRVVNAVQILVIAILLMIGVVYRANNEMERFAGLEYHNDWLLNYSVCVWIGLGIILVTMVVALILSKGRRRFVSVIGVRNLLVAFFAAEMVADYRNRFLMYGHDDKFSILYIGIIMGIILVAGITEFILKKRCQTD